MVRVKRMERLRFDMEVTSTAWDVDVLYYCVAIHLFGLPCIVALSYRIIPTMVSMYK